MAQAKTKTDDTRVADLAPDVPTSGQELVVIDPADIAAATAAIEGIKTADAEKMQNFINWLHERAEGTDEDTYATMAAILRDITSGESAAEVLAERSTLRAEDIANHPLILHSFEIRTGDYEESMFQHYAAMTVSRPGMDDTRVVCCGATKVLMKLYALDMIGDLPQAFWFTAKKHKKGVIIDMVRS